ncbi:winged helix-turn-helix transcriptional regulator [Mycolicibacterium sp. 120270]|uniref:winged helix-turn-helix transcriptional regulator n=1 Tax=Mycolicibacterium sp. 120270 TaxID=3090600 RepID=UPI00299D91CE|nr:winged helix-turn-helix transcriptional regulator [Mycolicibacterium sp. 120270]MDX1884450.1 winged helix-turn-helix transcriptional regulator [Mycolicibacterium sp. 120270]
MIGERWALLVVRDLLLGPKRFTDLLAGLPGASSDVVAQRLRDLCEAGVVRRRRLAPPANIWVYELTSWGADLEGVILGLAGWVHQSPRMRYDLPLSVDSAMLSLKMLFDHAAARDIRTTIALHLGDERFSVRVDDGNLTIARAEADNPDAILVTDPASLLSLMRARQSLDELVAVGHLQTSGDRLALEQFVQLFPVPDQSGAEA